MRTAFCVSWLVAVLLAGWPAAHASLVRWVELEELGAAAELVVIGSVVSSRAVERPVAIGVFTDHTVIVDEVVKGAADGPVVVRLPGGTVGGRTTEVEGVPGLRLGARYLLVLHAYDARRFGEQGSATYYTVLGSTQGAWRLDADADGAIVARRDLHGGFVDASGALVQRPDAEALPVDELRARLLGGAR